MTEQIEHKVNRSGWPPGPWDEEPEDRIEWRSEGTPCLMVRNSMGAWCGYVGLAPGHPWYGREPHEASAHGGITFGSLCQAKGPICHVPQAGESDQVWWIGFDTAHVGDLIPSMEASRIAHGWPRSVGDAYRDAHYVRGEVERLAEQARAAG